MKRVSCLLLLFFAAQVLRGDGGLLQFRRTSDDYSVSVFTSPTPLRVGVADISILVQDQSGEAVLAPSVNVRFVRPDGTEMRVVATQAEATNKLMTATSVDLNISGSWSVFVRVVTAARKLPEIRGDISVGAAQGEISTYWPYIAVVPVAVLLFCDKPEIEAAANFWPQTFVVTDVSKC